MGKFITFEGTDGSGKTSIIQKVSAYYTAKGFLVLVTREPGGIRISEKIRDIILDKANIEMDPRTEALLFAASRRQHLVEKIIPALEKGILVICDRFVDSSLVYQGNARGLGVDEVLEINQFAIENRFPDLTIFVDVPPEIAIARLFQNAGRKIDRLDLETREFHQLVYEGYHTLMHRFPNRIKAIDGVGTIEEVSARAIALLEKYL
jgi:dTMP kinase